MLNSIRELLSDVPANQLLAFYIYVIGIFGVGYMVKLARGPWWVCMLIGILWPIMVLASIAYTTFKDH